jgi:Kef-type K+ transport system membrane component KefB/voltage-gated potassium channel Kch
MHELLRDIALCIIAAWTLGVVAQWLRQPVLLAYLAGGYALGPQGMRWILDADAIKTISELGLIFLLFMIGLEIDLKKILRAGKTILVTAAVQILVGTLAGVFFFKLLGYALGGGKWDALYAGVAAALSSTVIIVKVLYDKRELDTLTGRVTLGVLVLQDLFVILFLAVQPSLDQLAPGILALSLARVAVLVGVALAVSRYVLPPLFHRIARLPELVLVGAIAWCFLMGEFGHWLHLSREMGALIAGVAISTYPYALDVTAKVTSLRDFFVTLFFVGLGMTIPRPDAALVLGAVGFAGFVLVSRFLTVFPPLYALGQGLRASLLPAINLSQISEFSLVLMTLGLGAGHLSAQTSGAVSLAFVLLATLSTFAMSRSETLARRTGRLLQRAGLKDLDVEYATLRSQRGEENHGHGGSARILVLGFFRTASSLVEEMARRNDDLLQQLAVIDFNPVALAGLKGHGVPVKYGDISQRDTLLHAGLAQAQVLISTVPDSLLRGITNEKLVRQLRAVNAEATIIATADTLPDVAKIYAAGANYVLVPRLAEAGELLEVLHAIDDGLLMDKRAEQAARLDERHEVLP